MGHSIQIEDMVSTEETPNEGQISDLKVKQCPTNSNLHNSKKFTSRDIVTLVGSSNELQVQMQDLLTQVLVDTGSAV